MEQNPKARRGYSRDGRPDCLQLVIALVITPEGFPLAYEVLKGNTSDRTTLRTFMSQLENTYGKARRVWVMRNARKRGSRDSERSDFEGTASAGAADVLSGGHA